MYHQISVCRWPRSNCTKTDILSTVVLFMASIKQPPDDAGTLRSAKRIAGLLSQMASLYMHVVNDRLICHTCMMTSSNGIIFRVTGPLCGEFTGPGEFPTQRPVTRSFDVFFDLRPNKRLSKQPWGWWFETPSWSLWRHVMEYRFWGLRNELPFT